MERRLLARVAWLSLVLRVALSTLPFPTLERLVTRLARPRAVAPLPAERIGWAVTAVGRRLPDATCLVRALVGSILLRRQGTPAIVRIGVARDPGGPLESHAWLESEGRVVVGDVALDRYARMTTWGTP